MKLIIIRHKSIAHQERERALLLLVYGGMALFCLVMAIYIVATWS